MPVFQTFADYDKWRRRQLLQRLQKLQNLPLPMDSVVSVAAKAGDALIKYGQLSRGLQDGISRDSFPSDAISAGLQKGIDTTEGDFRDNLSAAFRKILEDAADQTTGGKGKGKDKGTPPKGGGKDKGKDGGGQGPGGRGGGGPAEGPYGGDLVMAEHDGVFYTKTLVQLVGLGATIPPDDALDDYTLSVWIRIPTEVSATARITSGAPANKLQSFFWNANGSMQFNGYNERGTLYALDNTGSTDLLTNNQLHHLMVGVTDGGNKVQIWLDGALVSDQVYAGSFLPLGEEVEWVIGAHFNGTVPMDIGQEIGAMWQGNEFVADPVGVFIEAAGATPTALTGGADGSGFTGTQPLIYFNEIADWNDGTNRGSGGAFTVQAGTLIEATAP